MHPHPHLHPQGTGPSVNPEAHGATLETDIDARCREIQKEMDRAAHNSNETMDSGVLHAARQRFPTTVLRLELERELDRLLREQVQHTHARAHTHTHGPVGRESHRSQEVRDHRD